MKRRRKCVETPPDQHDHQVCPHQSSLDPEYYTQKHRRPKPPPPNLSSHPVLTTEHGYGGVSGHGSEPVYQDIREIGMEGSHQGKKDISMLEQTTNTYYDKPVISRGVVGTKLKPSDVPKDDPKHIIVYGVITAKEVAKYRPCTQDIIIRTE